MKRWIEEGTDEVRKKKRYIHRHLALPEGHCDDEGKELLITFAYEYVNALLTYASDDMKEGMCLVLADPVYLPWHESFHTIQDITFCRPGLQPSSRGSLWVKCARFTSLQSTLSWAAHPLDKRGNRVVITPRYCSIPKKDVRAKEPQRDFKTTLTWKGWLV